MSLDQTFQYGAVLFHEIKNHDYKEALKEVSYFVIDVKIADLFQAVQNGGFSALSFLGSYFCFQSFFKDSIISNISKIFCKNSCESFCSIIFLKIFNRWLPIQTSTPKARPPLDISVLKKSSVIQWLKFTIEETLGSSTDFKVIFQVYARQLVIAILSSALLYVLGLDLFINIFPWAEFLAYLFGIVVLALSYQTAGPLLKDYSMKEINEWNKALP